MNEARAASEAASTGAALSGYAVRPSTAGRSTRSAATGYPGLAATSLGTAVAGSSAVTALVTATSSACARLTMRAIRTRRAVHATVNWPRTTVGRSGSRGSTARRAKRQRQLGKQPDTPH